MLALCSGATFLLLPTPVWAQVACESDAWRSGALALDTYLDSALVTTALGAQWNPDWGRVIATFEHDPRREGDRVWIGTSAPEVEGLDRVAAWLVQSRRPVALTEADPPLMVLVGDGGELALRSVQFTSCPPTLTNPAAVTAALRELRGELRSHYSSNQLDRLQTTVEVQVSETGFLIDVRFPEPTGIVHLEEALPGLLRTVAEFEAGKTEGIPVSGWVSYPISFTSGG
jgi:hypothetical protein